MLSFCDVQDYSAAPTEKDCAQLTSDHSPKINYQKMNADTDCSKSDRLRSLLEALTGRQAPITPGLIPEDATLCLDVESEDGGLGYSQFNELLLLFGFDRVIPEFFQFLVDGQFEFSRSSSIESWSQLEEGVTRFRKTALVLFGNIKFAFDQLSQEFDNLDFWLDTLEEIPVSDFESRHDPILGVEEIPGDETYMLGYLAGAEIEQALQNSPDNPKANEDKRRRDELVKQGIRNHHAYLVSDHLDVYVATSMRQRHEFISISQLTKEIFEHESIKPLGLRYFDPTQAYCPDRLDKGLAEALMLRRAKCTVYFAQETDTLGKDSELASTLAQGKPVIAYVPEVDSDYAKRLVNNIEGVYPGRSRADIVIEQLKVFQPGAAWEDRQVAEWASAPESIPEDQVLERLQSAIKEHYDKRASTLKEKHPLGIQVHLMTGVANGVLVVRNINDCAELIRRIMTRTMEFDLEESEEGATLLRERISKCVFRVVTGDLMLTNAFWNFYLDPST